MNTSSGNRTGSDVSIPNFLCSAPMTNWLESQRGLRSIHMYRSRVVDLAATTRVTLSDLHLHFFFFFFMASHRDTWPGCEEVFGCVGWDRCPPSHHPAPAETQRADCDAQKGETCQTLLKTTNPDLCGCVTPVQCVISRLGGRCCAELGIPDWG